MANNVLNFWRNLSTDDPFEPLFEAAPIILHSIDANGVLVNVSRFWSSKLGYEPSEMIGRRSTEFLTEESREYALKTVLPEFFERGQISNIEYDFVRKDGTILPVLMSAVAQYDENERFLRSLAIMFDNSEKKRFEAELLKESRTKAIGALAGGVAHDFNNLLTIILGNLEFLKAEPESPERDDFIDSAIQAAKRGAMLTQQLLFYGRKAHLSPRRANLNKEVMGFDRMVRRLLPASISLEVVVGAGLWDTHVDVTQFETALLNIVNNARDAMPNGGQITIETCNARISEDYIMSPDEVITPGRYVMVAITDTGTGMPPETAEKIFEPFFTTKEVGHGTGLGLSMVFGFMKQSQGAIRTYSEVGVGTTFRLYFPALNPAKVVDADQSEPREISAGLREIMLVEDEQAVRTVMARQLRRHHFTVREFATGDQAIDEIRWGYKPAAMVTDLVMPGCVQGPELATLARQILPDLDVIFVSGYPTDAMIHSIGVPPHEIQFMKPVNEGELVDAINQLLRKSG